MGKVSEKVYFDFKLANHVSVQYQNDNVRKYYIFRNLPKNLTVGRGYQFDSSYWNFQT